MSQLLIKDRYLVQRVLVDLEYVTRSVCIDTILGREVLLTQLKGRTGRMAAVQERFQTDARAAARLSHAHIVALYDVDSWNGLPIAIQEYAHSETLRDVIESEGPFHPDDVGILVEHIAEALDFADQRGIAHLALRPEIVHIDYDGQALVTDFGIGQALDAMAPPPIDALPYRAPEQHSGSESAGHRADIYTLGTIAYEMLTGRLPFGAGSHDDYAARLLSGDPPAPSAVRPEVPPAAGSIVLKAIARRPADRFPTAAAFADALVNWRDAAPNRRTAEPTLSALDPNATLPVAPLSEANSAEEDMRRSRLAAILAWAGVAIGVAVLLWAGFQLLGIDDADSPAEPTRISIELPTATTAPDRTASSSVPTAVSLIGSTLAEAETLTDLPIRITGEEASDSAADGEIVRQVPGPGQPVIEGELLVVLSSGPAQLDLADLDLPGLSFEDAASELTAAGVNVLRVDEGSETVPEGRVIRLGVDNASPGDTVPVVVSMGDQVQVPQELLGMPVDEAVATMEELGLEVNEPVAVSRETIDSAGLDMDAFAIENGDVVGFQEEEARFGLWLSARSTVTPVYFDASL